MSKLLRCPPRFFCSYCLLGALILATNLALLWHGTDGLANPYGWFMSWRLGATNMFNFRLDQFSYHFLMVLILLHGFASMFLHNYLDNLQQRYRRFDEGSGYYFDILWQILFMFAGLMIMAADLYTSLAMLLCLWLLVLCFCLKFQTVYNAGVPELELENFVEANELLDDNPVPVGLYRDPLAMFHDISGVVCADLQYTGAQKLMETSLADATQITILEQENPTPITEVRFTTLQKWLVVGFFGGLLAFLVHIPLEKLAGGPLDYFIGAVVDRTPQQDIYLALLLLLSTVVLSLPMTIFAKPSRLNLLQLVSLLLFIAFPVLVLWLRCLFFLTDIAAFTLHIYQLLPWWQILLAIAIAYHGAMLLSIRCLNPSFFAHLLQLQVCLLGLALLYMHSNDQLPVAQNMLAGFLANQLLLCGLMGNLYFATWRGEIRQPLLGFFTYGYSTVGSALVLLACGGLPVWFNVVNSFIILGNVSGQHLLFWILWCFYLVILVIKVLQFYRHSFYGSIDKKVFNLEWNLGRENLYQHYTTLLPLGYLLMVNLLMIIFNFA